MDIDYRSSAWLDLYRKRVKTLGWDYEYLFMILTQ